MTTHTRNIVQLTLAVVLTVSGLAMLFIGMFVQPVGQIHPSVLTAFGEVATFAGALIGVDYTYRYKVTRIINGTESNKELEKE